MWNDRDIRILGLMVGSSLDGIDLAICRFSPDRSWTIERAETVPLNRDWRSKLEAFEGLSYREGALLDVAFGIYLGEVIRDWLRGDIVDLIGIHGYTVIHDPANMVSKQLGIGRAVHHTTAIPVVDGFRSEDVLGGGSGAPLVPVVERDLITETGFFVNLGGIMNASAHGKEGEVRALDLTGCNQIANALAAEKEMAMDRDGKLSTGGTVLPDLLDSAANICRDELKVPSISNEWVRGRLLPLFTDPEHSLADRLMTLYAHESNMLRDFFVKNASFVRSQEVLITGGGAWNPVLMGQIRQMLAEVGIAEKVAAPQLIDFKEALLIAWMAYLKAVKLPLGAWVWTGASRDHLAGTAYGLW